MFIFSTVIQSLLLAYYLFSGTAKVIGAKYWADIFAHLGLPQWFRVFTGFVQLAGVAALCAGYWYNWATALAGAWLGITMLVAFFMHIRVRDSFGKAAPPLVFAALNIIIFCINASYLTNLF
jgi:hypothetical protein